MNRIAARFEQLVIPFFSRNWLRRYSNVDGTWLRHCRASLYITELAVDDGELGRLSRPARGAGVLSRGLEPCLRGSVRALHRVLQAKFKRLNAKVLGISVDGSGAIRTS